MREQSRVPLFLTRPLLLRGSMKAKITFIIIAAALAACKTAPPCPPGTRQMGEAPPTGSETWCAKTVNGQHVGWYTNGKIAATGLYKNGKREGVWKRWDPQGFKNWEETYKDDKKIS